MSRMINEQLYIIIFFFSMTMHYFVPQLLYDSFWLRKYHNVGSSAILTWLFSVSEDQAQAWKNILK